MNSANKRIVRNTGLLYFRLILLTIINFYAVRVTLQALGEVDFGIFNVIGSVAGALTILSAAMTSASQRFLSYHLGRNDLYSYSHTFTLLLIAFIAISVMVVIVGEILGYFFVEHWLKIPEDRISAAYWVYQASLLAVVLGLLTIPYNSSIVANERMDAFAAFSVVEGVLKLGVALMLVYYGGDRLELYGFLTAGIGLIVFLMSMAYCHVKFTFCKYVWKWSSSVFKHLTSYTGWNLFGSVSAMLAVQGQNILLGLFFGPLVNAAKGIADKILHVISGFSINLYMAISPQIIKSYAAEDYKRALMLVVKTSKIAFLLLYVLSFPLICNMKALLSFWLPPDTVSNDMVVFSKLIMIYCMIIALESPISRIIQATGNIKKYQLSVGMITLCFIPIAALVLWLGGSPAMTLVVQICVISVAQVVRVVVAHGQVGLDYRVYAANVVFPIVRIFLVSLPLYWVIGNFEARDLLLVFLQTLVAAIFGFTLAWLVGMDKSDRHLVINLIKSKFIK